MQNDWMQDLELFRQLGINTVRIYEARMTIRVSTHTQTDPQANHDAFMKAASDAGIYVLIDLPCTIDSDSKF
jgi:beta-galactosidase GanA